MRPAHYLGKARGASLPATLIFFDTETQSVRLDAHTVEARLWFGWACVIKKSTAGGWGRERWHRFDSPGSFWNWVEKQCRDKIKVWAFSHNVAFDSTVLRIWDSLAKRKWKTVKAIIEGPPTVIAFRKGLWSLQLVDSLNFARMSLAKIGESMGIPKLPMPSVNASRREWDTYCKRDVAVLKAFMLTFMDFIMNNDLGALQITLASQAFVAFRHRLNGASIFIDSNPKALDLARSCYMGGRVECYRLGTVLEPLYQLDVNSMYPYVMRGRPYPTVLVGVYTRVKAQELSRLLSEYMLCGQITVNTSLPIYPVRIKGRLCFPVGRFSTLLTTPEIKTALVRGHVEHVGKLAVYKAGEPFTPYVDTLYSLRHAYREQGNDAFAWLCKIMLNSLYGKFGQNGRVFNTFGRTDDMTVKQWIEYDLETRQILTYRQIGGLIQTRLKEGESLHSHPAIAAHVTGYARVYLWNLMEWAGLDNIWYVDTDSLFVNEIGFNRLQDHIGSDELGLLKIERVVSSGEFRGVKDYTIEGYQKIKGIRGNAMEIRPGVFAQETFVGFRGMIRRGDLSRQLIVESVKVLSREYHKGTVDGNGAIRAYILG